MVHHKLQSCLSFTSCRHPRGSSENLQFTSFWSPLPSFFFLFFFAPCQLGEPKRHRGPFFWAVAHRRCVIGEKLVSFVLSSVPLSPPLNCPAATPCPPPCLRLSTHTYIHPPTQPQLHKGNEIEREMSCVSVKDLRWCGDGLSGWCTVASQGYTLFRMIATNRKAFICKTSLI